MTRASQGTKPDEKDPKGTTPDGTPPEGATTSEGTQDPAKAAPSDGDTKPKREASEAVKRVQARAKQRRAERLAKIERYEVQPGCSLDCVRRIGKAKPGTIVTAEDLPGGKETIDAYIKAGVLAPAKAPEKSPA